MKKTSDLLNNLIATTMSRRSGKTSAIAKAAKEIGATVICANRKVANDIKDIFEVKTTTIHSNLRGTTGPYLYDHQAIEEIMAGLIKRIEELEEKFENLPDHIKVMIRLNESING